MMHSDPTDGLADGLENMDVVMHAAAAAGSAAARLYALLGEADKDFDFAWLTDDIDLDEVDGMVRVLAGHVCATRLDNAETLYRHAAGLVCPHDGSDWPGETMARKLAWTLFQSVCLSVFDVLDTAQKRLAADRRLTEQAMEHAPLQLEDSIFAPLPGLGDMLPHAKEALNAAAGRIAAAVPEPEAAIAPMSAAGGEDLSAGEFGSGGDALPMDALAPASTDIAAGMSGGRMPPDAGKPKKVGAEKAKAEN